MKKQNAKTNKKNKILLFITIFVILIPALFYYALYQAYSYIEERDGQIFQTGYEIGRYDQLNEDAENTQQEIKNKQQVSKQTLLNNLAKLESQNGHKRKILDTNGRYSLGLYHFQARTVQDMYKRYYGKKINITEAVKIAENDELSTKLAHDAIFVHKEYFHWKISLCKLGVKTNNCLTQKQINNLFAKK